jgi:hypothetical protein
MKETPSAAACLVPPMSENMHSRTWGKSEKFIVQTSRNSGRRARFRLSDAGAVRTGERFLGPFLLAAASENGSEQLAIFAQPLKKFRTPISASDF